jgi:hypothetical protein
MDIATPALGDAYGPLSSDAAALPQHGSSALLKAMRRRNGSAQPTKRNPSLELLLTLPQLTGRKCSNET